MIISISLSVLLVGGGATGWILYQNGKIPFLSQQSIKASAIKVNQQKVDKLESSDQQAKDFIAEHHDVLNDLTGWSAIEHPDWPAVQEEATAIKNTIGTIEVKERLSAYGEARWTARADERSSTVKRTSSLFS